MPTPFVVVVHAPSRLQASIDPAISVARAPGIV
jgi:hypothetical protein